MDHAPRSRAPAAGAEIVDFDEARLDACPTAQLAEVMAEAIMLADAFGPEDRTLQIRRLARSLQSGARDFETGRARARLVAAALRRLARTSEG
ncbi:hypothetical protein LJR225_001401 [Phenylobacterium sp. LjRoot225]|uniref:hypothetical protein n=1 Tax=Phenylobacterium sp. LjRoot225 TaxID=3342285 RepID=UPI003ECE46E2